MSSVPKYEVIQGSSTQVWEIGLSQLPIMDDDYTAILEVSRQLKQSHPALISKPISLNALKTRFDAFLTHIETAGLETGEYYIAVRIENIVNTPATFKETQFTLNVKPTGITV